MLKTNTVNVLSATLLSLAAACSDDDSPDKTTADSAVTGSPQGVDGGMDGGADPNLGVTAQTLPIVFVHGFVGSASQFDSQAIRFVANGYPANRIRAYEHHGLGGEDFVAGLTAYVNGVLSEFSVSQVYLVGHSRGTAVSNGYLATPENAAKVAKYVSLDGAGCDGATAAGVACIDPNQGNQPGEKHVEVATSATSFNKMYQFFLGSEPAVKAIVKQNGTVKISGRAVNFPENTGRSGTTLTIWEVNSDTGARVGNEPLHTFTIGADGNWGPATVSPDKHYEMALTVDGNLVQHFYFQRFLRDSQFVRLLSGPPESASRVNTNISDAHAAVTLLRMREWTQADVINVSTTSASGGNQPVVNAVTSETRDGSIGFYIHDDKATPAMTSLALLPYFSTQAFQMGVDVYMPASDPPDGTVTINTLPRGDAAKPQTLNVPNWPSSSHTIMAFFSDYPQD